MKRKEEKMRMVLMQKSVRIEEERMCCCQMTEDENFNNKKCQLHLHKLLTDKEI